MNLTILFWQLWISQHSCDNCVHNSVDLITMYLPKLLWKLCMSQHFWQPCISQHFSSRLLIGVLPLHLLQHIQSDGALDSHIQKFSFCMTLLLQYSRLEIKARHKVMGLKCFTYGREEMCSWFWFGDLKTRTILKTICDGRVIVKGYWRSRMGEHQLNSFNLVPVLLVQAVFCMVLNSNLCIHLYSQQKGQSVKLMDSKLTTRCRILKWSVRGYSAGQNITAVW